VPSADHSRPVNHLLRGLPRAERQRIVAGCEEVQLALGDVLSEQGERMLHAYFPSDGCVSQIALLDGLSATEVGLIGNEGMVGVCLVLGVDVSPLQFIVQGAGQALRMNAASFRRVLKDSLPLQRQLNHYVYVVMAQLAQTAVCSTHHLVEARLARWLLMTQDRAQSEVLTLTHEFLAYMLGVRRGGVTRAAGSLQSRNVITYARGRIVVQDRAGLMNAACGCYQADLDIYSRILP